MRVAVLAPGPWSEYTLALVTELARRARPPVGIASLPTWHWRTLVRKSMQWGPRSFAAYALRRVYTDRNRPTASLRNPHLAPLLQSAGASARNLVEFGRSHGVPVVLRRDLNADAAVREIRGWRPDVVIYTGGGIVRRGLLESAPHGVWNAHLGPLPAARGMSAPEWSLLMGLAPGVTVHQMDTGIDTGPVLAFRPLATARGMGLDELRGRLAALAVELLIDTLEGAERGEITPLPQPDSGADLQHFVMHESLRALAERRLRRLATGESPPPLHRVRALSSVEPTGVPADARG